MREKTIHRAKRKLVVTERDDCHDNIISEGIDYLFAHLPRNKFILLRNHGVNHFFEGIDLGMGPIPSPPEVHIQIIDMIEKTT